MGPDGADDRPPAVGLPGGAPELGADGELVDLGLRGEVGVMSVGPRRGGRSASQAVGGVVLSSTVTSNVASSKLKVPFGLSLGDGDPCSPVKLITAVPVGSLAGEEMVREPGERKKL
jgi:hypothetical protein